MSEVMHFDSADAVLEFAIEREEEARDFYLEWEKKVEKKHLPEILREFAAEEEKHKELLQNVQKGNPFEKVARKVIDLKIGDYFIDEEADEQMTYQQALQIAIKREIGAQELYIFLGSISENTEYKNLFEGLFKEESKHKLRLEAIYDEEFMREN